MLFIKKVIDFTNTVYIINSGFCSNLNFIFYFGFWLLFILSFCCFLRFGLVSPEFAYRPGLGVVAEGAPSGSSPGATGSGGAPNRPLPPTPDDDDSQGDKTLVLRRVSNRFSLFAQIICILRAAYADC